MEAGTNKSGDLVQNIPRFLGEESMHRLSVGSMPVTPSYTPGLTANRVNGEHVIYAKPMKIFPGSF